MYKDRQKGNGGERSAQTETLSQNEDEKENREVLGVKERAAGMDRETLKK